MRAHPLRRLLACGRRGVAALELAVLMPILILILVVTADLGVALEQSIRLETAARNGAQFAISYPTSTQEIRDQVSNSLPGWNDITVGTPTLRCVCPGNAAIDCSNEVTCGTFTEQYLTITVSRPHRPVLRTSLSLLSSVSVIEGRAEVRLR
jgi:Flp pilus assembly protein TadG